MQGSTMSSLGLHQGQATNSGEETCLTLCAGRHSASTAREPASTRLARRHSDPRVKLWECLLESTLPTHRVLATLRKPRDGPCSLVMRSPAWLLLCLRHPVLNLVFNMQQTLRRFLRSRVKHFDNLQPSLLFCQPEQPAGRDSSSSWQPLKWALLSTS